MFDIISHDRNATQSHSQISLHFLLAGYKFQKWTITSVNKDVKKLEPSNIAGGNVKFCSCCRKNLTAPQQVKYIITIVIFAVQLLNHVRLFAVLWKHTRLPCPSPTPRACSNSCPLCQWCYATISSSVVPFSSHLQSFPASGSFPMSWLFASGGQSIGASASASVLSMNIQS